MKEGKYYRDHLEAIKERFGDKELLSISEVCEWLDMDRHTALDSFDFVRYGNRWRITRQRLARGM